jgi:hypothetical protein
MREEARKAFQYALKQTTDPAARQWLRLMLKGEPLAPHPRPPSSRDVKTPKRNKRKPRR